MSYDYGLALDLWECKQIKFLMGCLHTWTNRNLLGWVQFFALALFIYWSPDKDVDCTCCCDLILKWFISMEAWKHLVRSNWGRRGQRFRPADRNQVLLVLCCELYCCCLLSSRYTIAPSRIMLFNWNLFNYMLFWFYPLALICSSQCMLHVLASNFVLGLSRCLWTLTYAAFALSCKSLWIKASAKWLNVNVPGE